MESVNTYSSGPVSRRLLPHLVFDGLNIGEWQWQIHIVIFGLCVVCLEYSLSITTAILDADTRIVLIGYKQDGVCCKLPKRNMCNDGDG